MNTVESPSATMRMLLQRGINDLEERRKWLLDYGDFKKVADVDKNLSMLRSQLEAIDV